MSKKIKNLIIFGTRPEAIKMAPLIKEFQKHNELFDTKICLTAQHREMLDQVLDFFEIEADFDLDLMKPNQTLNLLTSAIIKDLEVILKNVQPDYVFVHGDTTTSMVASLAGFYNKSNVCHIEAGLRTHNKYSPFPEEINRKIVGVLSDYHFAPTKNSKDNLINEGVDKDSIFVVGNTVIDALFWGLKKLQNQENHEIEKLKKDLDVKRDIVLVTGHRRENHGQGFINICNALKRLSKENTEIQIVYPVHLNPKVKNIVHSMLSGINNIHLVSPLSYPSFIWLINKSKIILTDSGGIQEEAPSLGKPVIVLRDTTERQEAIDEGTALLAGTEEDVIFQLANTLLNNKKQYLEMSSKTNPYGDGKASERIVNLMTKSRN